VIRPVLLAGGAGHHGDAAPAVGEQGVVSVVTREAGTLGLHAEVLLHGGGAALDAASDGVLEVEPLAVAVVIVQGHLPHLHTHGELHGEDVGQMMIVVMM
jgi:hypothetical protein